MPMHLYPYFKKKDLKKRQFPVAEKYGECSLSLPFIMVYQLKNLSDLQKN